jgi:hypothetical protein
MQSSQLRGIHQTRVHHDSSQNRAPIAAIQGVAMQMRLSDAF